MIGKTINQYKITEHLGSGGMGEVYLAVDTKLDRKVALKFLPESMSQDTEARERLQREARSASKISHPNILTVYSVEEFEGSGFIVMEYVDGLTLEDFIEQTSPRLDEILGVAVGIALGLAKAHQAGIVHRDLKPSNILIDEDKRARIFDFGLAKLPGAAKLTREGSTLGTFAYMSPEQGRGEDSDSRADIFSFGVILYEMITRHAPFTGDHEAALLYVIANEEPDPLARYAKDIPDEVQRIASKCLAKRPQDRYQSAADLATDLKQVRRSMISGSRVSVLSQPVPKPRRKGLIASAVITAAVILAVFILKPWKIVIEPTQEASAVENRLAVMYFDNVADPQDSERLGEIATTLLITDLSESQYVQVVSSQHLLDILGLLGRGEEKKIDHATATAVAKKAQARWMLMGSILKTSPNIVVTAQLVDVATGNAIASQRINGADGEDIFALVDRLTVDVKRDLSLPAAAASESDPSIADGTTHSTEAYRYYLEGIEQIDKFYRTEAEASLRKAIAIDSTFAMAYFRLTLDGMGSATERKEWRAIALRHSQNLPRKDRWFIEGEAAWGSGDIKGAQVALEKITTEYPDEKMAHFQLAYLHRNAGRLQDAIGELENVIAIDPKSKLAYNLEAYVYNFMGNLDQSITAINKYIALAPDEANPYDSRADLYAYNGRLKDAAASYREALSRKPSFYMSRRKLGQVYLLMGQYASADSCFTVLSSSDDASARAAGRTCLGLPPAFQGRFDEALRILRDGATADRMENQQGDDYRGKLNVQALLLGGKDEYARALELVQRADSLLEVDAPDNIVRQRPWKAILYAYLDQYSVADSILAGVLRDAKNLDTSLASAYYSGAGTVAFIRGQFQQAQDFYQKSDTLKFSFYDHRMLGKIHLKLGEYPEAIAEFERIVGHFNEDAAYDPMLMVGSHYYLGMAYEKSGWVKRAMEQYQTLLDIWKDADADAPYVADARERLAKLQTSS